METQITQYPDNDYRENLPVRISEGNAVAWCAVFAGAVASASLSLILLFLGTGFGLTLISPWSSQGISATSFSVSSIIGVTVISLLASAMGGYLAGRLRTRWVNTPRDEVFFRDTAHGFLSWSVATLGTAALLTSVIGTIIGAGVKAGTTLGATAIAGAATTAIAHDEMGDGKRDRGMKDISMPYVLDSLFRKPANVSNSSTIPSASNPVNPTPIPPVDRASSTASDSTPTNDTNPNSTATMPTQENVADSDNDRYRGEISRILMNALATGSLPEEDLEHASRLVAQTTGVDEQTARDRVQKTFSTVQTKLQEAKKEAKEAADKAREISAATSLWMFIALLCGAFIASLMAVYGGRQRDL